MRKGLGEVVGNGEIFLRLYNGFGETCGGNDAFEVLPFRNGFGEADNSGEVAS
jgi:hypothetical protein